MNPFKPYDWWWIEAILRTILTALVALLLLVVLGWAVS